MGRAPMRATSGGGLVKLFEDVAMLPPVWATEGC